MGSDLYMEARHIEDLTRQIAELEAEYAGRLYYPDVSLRLLSLYRSLSCAADYYPGTAEDERSRLRAKVASLAAEAFVEAFRHTEYRGESEVQLHGVRYRVTMEREP